MKLEMNVAVVDVTDLLLLLLLTALADDRRQPQLRHLKIRYRTYQAIGVQETCHNRRLCLTT
jgi:hypothetical protein